MNKTLILSLAAAIVAGTASFAPAAQAGGGIRLQFGGALGSFVARPSHGSYAAHSPSGGSSSGASCHKKAPSYASHRPAPEPRVASRSYDAKPKPAYHKSNTDRSSNNDDVASNDNGDTTSPETTGSKALFATDTPIVQTATPEDDKTKVAAVEPAETASTTTTSATEVLGPPAPVVEEVKPVVVEKSKKSTKEAAKKEDCKKFIPSVGVTISVGC